MTTFWRSETGCFLFSRHDSLHTPLMIHIPSPLFAWVYLHLLLSANTFNFGMMGAFFFFPFVCALGTLFAWILVVNGFNGWFMVYVPTWMCYMTQGLLYYCWLSSDLYYMVGFSAFPPPLSVGKKGKKKKKKSPFLLFSYGYRQ